MNVEHEDSSQTELSHTTSTEGTTLVEWLLKRCQTLLDELEAFRVFLEDAKQGQKAEHLVDIKQFYSPVATEMKSLQKVG